MHTPSPPEPGSKLQLEQISTRWSIINSPAQFVMCYAPAIQRYLNALIRNADDAEEVLQNFLLRVVQRGFVESRIVRGRFRDYLKAAVRNAALTHFRRRQSCSQGTLDWSQVSDPADDGLAGDQGWVSDWRRCLLDRAWHALEGHQRHSPGNLSYTVLRLSVDHPDEDSKALAVRASALAGRPLRSEAFRKQASRARRLFAQLLVDEIARTLEDPNPEEVEAELIELGLMHYVQDFLPPDWRTRGTLSAPAADSDP